LTMMLSMLPAEHGFQHFRNYQFIENPPVYPQEFTFLPEVFQAAGYRTAGFVGNPFLQESTGFRQGFDEFLYSFERGYTLTKPAMEWLEESVSDPQPSFLYLHYFDVHWPYNPVAPFLAKFPPPIDGRPVYFNGKVSGIEPQDLQTSVDLYDGEIAYVDQQIKQIVRTLKKLKIRKDTILVITSDHGEEFMEHGGLGHGTNVYGGLVRVPLMIVAPGRLEPGRRVDHLTHHIDLAPTLLELAGLPPEDSFRGSNLNEPSSQAFAETGPWRGVYRGNRKLIVNLATRTTELFALDDELDLTPLQEDSSQMLGLLQHYLALEPDAAATSVGSTTSEWSQEELERLRAAGYLEGDGR